MRADADLFETLVRDAPDPVVAVDESGTVVFANRAVRRVFGYDADDLVGEPLTVLMADDLGGAYRESIRRYVADGDPTVDWSGAHFQATHRDGHRLDVTVALAEHTLDDQRVFSGVVRESTDSQRHEPAVEARSEQFERFAGLVSHELRDPLNAARAQLALGRETDDPEHFAELERSLDRLETLVERLLTLTKAGRAVGEPQPVTVARVARKAWETADTRAATLEIEDGLGRVVADPERLRTVFEHLFGNAVEHGTPNATADADGDATATADADADDADASPASVAVGVRRLAADGDDATDGDEATGGEGFAVADDGPGIPPARRETVFEYGTSSTGTGLGLYIVRRITDAHGWTVTAAESERGGARFEFRGVTRP